MVPTLLVVARVTPPQEFQSMLGGLIANVVGNLPDHYWEDFKRITPCDVEGCTCHLDVMPKVIEALDILRKDHRDYLAKKKAQN